MVLMALAKHANDDGTKCFPNVDTLAALARVNRSTVQRSLAILEGEGMITVLHRGGAGRGDVNRYLLYPKAIEKGRSGNPFADIEKGHNAAKKGTQPGAGKGRSEAPDSVKDSVNYSARAGRHGARSGNGASTRARESQNPINKSSHDKPASPAVVEDHLKVMSEIIGYRRKGGPSYGHG